MKASDLKGRAVVTLSDAIKVGRVDDVLLDAGYREVLGFRIKAGTFSRLEAVSRANVTGVGHAAVTVRSPDVINVEDRLSALAGAVPLSRGRPSERRAFARWSSWREFSAVIPSISPISAWSYSKTSLSRKTARSSGASVSSRTRNASASESLSYPPCGV